MTAPPSPSADARCPPGVSLAFGTLRRCLNRCMTKRDDALLFGNRFLTAPAPSDTFPEEGMAATDAMRLVDVDLAMEGDPQRNLATFVTTWMEPEAQRLIAENLHRNFIDHAEYPLDDGQVRRRDLKYRPPGAERLVTPYDIDARGSVKRGIFWDGYKVHLTETCEPDRPKLITHVATTKSTVQDVRL